MYFRGGFMRKIFLGALLIMGMAVQAQQYGEVRGVIYEKETGAIIDYANVYLKENRMGAVSDGNGFYFINRIPAGTYTLFCSYLGYDSASIKITIKPGGVTVQNLYLPKATKDLTEVLISAEKQDKLNTTQIAKTKITMKEMSKLVTLGGEPDLIQSLQVLPGVYSSGDQGGQLYVRGGSPVMNKVLLDGMIIYQPFHSIGLFSVFDADIIRSADVYSAGFGAQYGGRVSAVVDVSTREGSKNRQAGKISVNPFTSKLLLEGPLKKYKEGAGSISYILSYKNSYLRQSAPVFYGYLDASRLPYTFQDLYGKISFVGSNGSKFETFGFNFQDQVNFTEATNFRWNAAGFGSKFVVLPDESKTKIDGYFNYSQYDMQQLERDGLPRNSKIQNFAIGMNFEYLLGRDQFVYGTEINTFRTDYQFTNANNRSVNQLSNNTELSLFATYRKVVKRFVFEPGFRVQYYASFSELFPEPRLAMKYNVTTNFRLKAAGGLYSQNLISAVSDRDVVNLFYGFLGGPDNLPKEFNGRQVNGRLQKAWHLVGGYEWDIGKHFDLMMEGYYKDFYQLTNINRDKLFEDNSTNASRPDNLKKDFIVEDGLAYGFDTRLKYENKGFYFWAVYSLTFVTRRDNFRTYAPHFDRRHNMNLVGSYTFGEDKSWEINARWNLGSGFPFTQTQAFYELQTFRSSISADYTKNNGELGLILSDINTGRLPYFHRLDISVQKTIKTGENSKLQLVAGVINAYNRNNIFYMDRFSRERVDQLPILPTIGANWSF